MSHSIAPHEPKELLVDSVDEVFEEAEASQKRWQEWEREHQLKSVRIQLSEAKYQVLEDLAKEQACFRFPPKYVDTFCMEGWKNGRMEAGTSNLPSFHPSTPYKVISGAGS